MKRMSMIKRLFLVFVMVLAAGVTACGPVYETSYSYTPPRSAEGRMCTSQCQQIQNLCLQNCRLEQQTCTSQARAEAASDYSAYVAERTAAKAPVKKRQSDFDYSYRCSSDSACESRCGNDFRFCYSNCGGQITSQRVCTAFCQ